jgi:hypothetical protein
MRDGRAAYRLIRRGCVAGSGWTPDDGILHGQHIGSHCTENRYLLGGKASHQINFVLPVRFIVLAKDIMEPDDRLHQHVGALP